MPTKIEKDAVTGIETTGHEWDGIKELNNPLPKWWLYVLYACILWSVGYWILYPSWPYLTGYSKGLLGWSQRTEIVERMAEARAAQAHFLDRIEAASLGEIREDPELLNFSLAGGRVAFGDNCAPCHGAGGAGNVGYPSLANDAWLWGGTLEDIHETILYGIRWDQHDWTRYSEMPRFGVDGILSRDEIADVADYVLAFTGRESSAQAAERGAEIYAMQCAACHADDGSGDRSLGAPALNDDIWVYGGSRETVIQSISNARFGVMPAWEGRLDEATIKQLTVYVHALGGGE